MAKTKKCNRCGKWKGLNCFYDRGDVYGLRKECKVCARARIQESQNRNIQTTKPDIEFLKRCCACLIEQSSTNFHRAKTKKDGRISMCKTCCKTQREHKKATIASMARTLTYKTCSKCNTRKRISHFSLANDRVDGYRSMCKECCCAKGHNQRALKLRQSPEEIPGEFFQELKAHYNYCCAYCDCRPKLLHIDHVHPLIAGGLHTRSNLLPSCPTCNHTKYSTLPDEWFKTIGRRFEFNGTFLVPISQS